MVEYLVGCRVKIDRAKKHLAELHSEIRNYLERDPYYLIVYSDLRTQHEIYQLRIEEHVPAYWGGIVGDVVHNVRSALDILANDLVLSNGEMPDDNTRFPISRAALYAKGDIHAALKGASERSLTLTKRLKPHVGGIEAFWRLHRLDIVDKHKLLVPVVPGHRSIQVTTWFRISEIAPYFSPRTFETTPQAKSRGKPLQDEMVLFTKDAAYKALSHNQYKFVIQIAFGETEVFAGREVISTLSDLVKFGGRVLDIYDRHIFMRLRS